MAEIEMLRFFTLPAPFPLKLSLLFCRMDIFCTFVGEPYNTRFFYVYFCINNRYCTHLEPDDALSSWIMKEIR